MSSYDISQYVRYFDTHDMELDIRRRNGEWSIVVYKYKKLDKPLHVGATAPAGHGFIVEGEYITHLKQLRYTTEPRTSLSEALHDAYVEVRAG